ncbi:Putative molybdenum carrier [Rubripirellula lacrimiformis]|uniref:Molybdenum carrier n=1 Tax=Rubripirellula lacrimiformis TaxID=1930273 RepID=A0A517NFC9_9BACT|nr:putative molybdenum carrier protein [Rubripirellula lacrimiformis]QDT05836.1 Putative molybdenum carrier [Rubripirellula lacrimiformis]
MNDSTAQPPADPTNPQRYLPRRIVSGGQTGVDRAGLDVAIALGIQHGGWCPRGRVAEDGTVPSRYDLVEHTSSRYPPRTAQNVIDSDATLIIYERRLKGGTLLTQRICKRQHKPHFVIRLDADSLAPAKAWLQHQRPDVLNVAGSRDTTAPGIYDRAMKALFELLDSGS